MFRILLVVAVSLISTSAYAHSKVNKTVPENGAMLTAIPVHISFQFAKKIRLTKVEMIHAQDEAVTLDLRDLNGFEKDVSVPLQGMGSGVYHLEWRGLGADGHPMQGEFMFEVQ